MHPGLLTHFGRLLRTAAMLSIALAPTACAPSQPLVRNPAMVVYADVPFEQLASPAQSAALLDKDSSMRCLFVLAVPIIPFADMRPEAYREGFSVIVLGNEQGVAMHGLLPNERLDSVHGLVAKTPVAVSGRLVREDGGLYFVVEDIKRAGDAVASAPDAYQVPDSTKYSIAPAPPAATTGGK